MVEVFDFGGDRLRVWLWCEVAVVEDGPQEWCSGGEFGEHRGDEVVGRGVLGLCEAIDLFGWCDRAVGDEARDRGWLDRVGVGAERDAGGAIEEAEARRRGEDLA